jgi:hypothetical protein
VLLTEVLPPMRSRQVRRCHARIAAIRKYAGKYVAPSGATGQLLGHRRQDRRSSRTASANRLVSHLAEDEPAVEIKADVICPAIDAIAVIVSRKVDGLGVLNAISGLFEWARMQRGIDRYR